MHDPPDSCGAGEKKTRGSGLAPEFDPHEGLRIAPRGGAVDGALEHLLAAIYASIAEGSWPRLKACERDSGRSVFYDRSKNRSGCWCDPADRGPRERSRRAYQRRRGTA
jgi:predicted RNA-binding Zn ribbon-like protein